MWMLLIALLAAVGGASDGYSGYRRQITKGRTESRECLVVRSDEELRKELRAIAWDMESYPTVNWANDVATIIAPSKRQRGQQIALFEVRSRDSNVVVEWGWAPWTSDATKVTLIGAGEQQQALVVWFPRPAGSVTCPLQE